MLTRTIGNRCVLWGALMLALALSGCDTSHDIAHPSGTTSSATGAATSARATSPTASHSASPGNAPATASAAAATSAAAPSSGQPPTAAALRAALLTPRDLPAGYSAAPVSGSGLGGSSITGCRALVSNPNGISASAGTALSDVGTGSTVVESLLQMSSGASAAQGLAGFATLPTSCRSFSGNVDGFTIAFATAPLPVSALGDQTTAARMTGKISGTGAMIDVDVVVVRRGSTLMEILCLGLTADTAFTRHVTQEAYATVAALR
jgi:hypothetical protein